MQRRTQETLDPRSGSRAYPVHTLNEVFSTRSTRRRYEVWFIRMGLADGAGAWWLRYLLMNPARGGCPGDPNGMPVQVWATWFPSDGKPQSITAAQQLVHPSLVLASQAWAARLLQYAISSAT